MQRLSFYLLIVAIVAHSNCVRAIEIDKPFDIVVYGSSPAGIMAAVQAAEMGKSTLLVSPQEHVGGMMTSGLGATDMNAYRLIGGQARKFFQRVYKHYLDLSAWRAETRDEYFARSVKRIYTGKADSEEMQWAFEPHVALKTFNEMLAESGVQVIRRERLDLLRGVVKTGNRIEAIRMESGRELYARMFIDASYEGDLLATAGVTYIVGRESNSTYDEKYNGVRPTEMGDLYASKVQILSIDPYVIAGRPDSGLLPFIHAAPPGAAGEGDRGVQAYCFRFTLTNDPSNRRAITKPKNYDPQWFEMYGRICEASPQIVLPKLLGIAPLPNKKTDINAANIPGANYEWADGDYLLREKLAQLHKDFALGKYWFLTTDPRVPPSMREELKQYGLPKDEFTDNDNFPYQVYVREARRMISDYVMTEHNELRSGTRHAEDGIAYGSYAVDSHQVGYYVDDQGKLWIDGSLWESARPYPISYRSIVPKESECGNLVVPVCVSSSHSAYGSLRMEPVYMVMGHSAGTAAALAIDGGCTVQQLPYDHLRTVLTAQGQIFVETK
jgi:hypothetical protein